MSTVVGIRTYVVVALLENATSSALEGARAQRATHTHAPARGQNDSNTTATAWGGFNRADRYVEQPLIWTSSCQRVGAHLLLMWVAHLIPTFLVALSGVDGKILTCEMCGSFRSEGGPLTPAE